MRTLAAILVGALLLGGCSTVVVPETSASSAATSSASSSSGSGGSGGASCQVALVGTPPPADTGNADGEGGASPAGTPFVTEWDTNLGGSGARIEDVAVDAAGDVLAVGSFTATVDFGGGVTLSDAAGGGFLVKLDPTGTALWAREVDPMVAHVAAGADGSAWIVDDEDPSTLTRIDATGTKTWETPFVGEGSQARLVPTADGGAIVSQIRGDALTKLDAAGNSAWTTQLDGLFWSTPPTTPPGWDDRTVSIVDLGAAPGGGATVLVSAYETLLTADSDCTGSAGLLLGVSNQGEVTWRRPLPYAEVTMSTDALGNVLLAQSVSESETGDLGHGKFYGGIALAMFDPAGEPRWGKHFAGAATALRPGFDAAGNILVAGSFTGNLDLGGGLMEGAGPASRFFVLEVSPHGQWMASRLFAAVGPDQGSPGDDGNDAQAMAVAPDGTVILAGNYQGAIDLGLGPLPAPAQYLESPVLARFGH